jgi:hypothetical protein
LRTNTIFNFTQTQSYNLPIVVTDITGKTFTKTFTINILDLPQAPTNIILSNTTIPENEPINTVVGTFTTTDPDIGNTHTYTLVSGVGSTDNTSFNILGN